MVVPYQLLYKMVALKIWSRNGSLRTNLIQNNTKSIYAVTWSS